MRAPRLLPSCSTASSSKLASSEASIFDTPLDESFGFDNVNSSRAKAAGRGAGSSS